MDFRVISRFPVQPPAFPAARKTHVSPNKYLFKEASL